MAYSIRGRPIETTFTPGVNGVVRVQVKFDLAWDLPGGGTGVVFCEQSGSTSYGSGASSPRYVRQSFTGFGTFPVVAGSLVKVGLAAGANSIYRMSFYALELTAEFFPS